MFPAGVPPGMPVDEMMNGLNEWRNIQEIVRMTFKALHDVVRAQGESIKKLEQNLEYRATKNDVEAVAATKASGVELSNAMAEITSQVTSALASKANLADISRTLSEHSRALGSKANTTELQVALESKASRLDIQHILDGRIANMADLHALVEENSRLIARMDHMERVVES